MHRVTVLVLALVAAVGAPCALAQERPLPDAQRFLQEVRNRLQTDEERQSAYAYVETRRERKLDKAGAPTKETVTVFESYPGLPGEPRWRRKISIDGTPVPQAELDKQDRERQKTVVEYQRKLDRQTDKERAAAARKRDEERRENDAILDDVWRVFELRMLGRDQRDGRDTIVFSMTPRANVQPKTREGRIAKHFAGKAWISEIDYELARIELEALDDVSFGLGLVARVHKGSHAAFERRRVNDDEWLPASAAYTGSARVMLLKVMRVDADVQFSNYRKFSVSTESTYKAPK